ncbi:MAG: GDP-mannose 4,6-dehydratase [Promethearchaeota archaeon]
MKVIITGSGGFIGSHAVDFFLEKNYEVVGTIKPGQKKRNIAHLLDPPHPRFTLVMLDLRDRASVEDLVEQHRPDLIIHLAAQSLVQPSWDDPAYTMEVNVLGTIYLFETVKRLELPCKVLVACSSAEYGISYEHERPLKETNNLRPVHPYGISKMAQEYLAKQYTINFGIDTRVVRFFNQTGPRKTKDASSDFARKIGKIEAGRAPPQIRVGNLETYRDITGIGDTLEGIWAVLERGKPGETYNICSGKPTKIRDVLDTLLGFSSRDIEVIENSEEKMRFTDEPIILGDNSKLREECGFAPRQDLVTVLREMFDYWVDYYSKK